MGEHFILDALTHLKLVCPHIPVSSWDAYIKNSTLEIAVTDIYEMFVLKYRIVKEETSVSKTCGVAFEWWLVLCTDHKDIVTYTDRSPSSPSECNSKKRKHSGGRMCWTVTLATQCMTAACKMPVEYCLTQLPRGLQVRVWVYVTILELPVYMKNGSQQGQILIRIQ